MMNPEWKQKWIDALRSGEYKQGYKYLRQTEEDGSISYCCLGVLCDIAGVDWKETDPYTISNGNAYRPHYDGYLSNESLLHPGVIEMTGVTSDMPFINGIALSSMNDAMDMTFEEIALEIELNL